MAFIDLSFSSSCRLSASSASIIRFENSSITPKTNASCKKGKLVTFCFGLVAVGANGGHHGRVHFARLEHLLEPGVLLLEVGDELLSGVLVHHRLGLDLLGSVGIAQRAQRLVVVDVRRTNGCNLQQQQQTKKTLKGLI